MYRCVDDFWFVSNTVSHPIAYVRTRRYLESKEQRLSSQCVPYIIHTHSYVCKKKKNVIQKTRFIRFYFKHARLLVQCNQINNSLSSERIPRL